MPDCRAQELTDSSTRNVTAGFKPSVWLADLTYTQQTVSADVMPYAIAGLATYLATQVDLAERPRIFKYPERIISALEADGPPDVLGFSNYVWNSDLCYSFAAAVKARFPDVVIVFGGPNFSSTRAEQQDFLRQRPAIDFYILKEGEIAFANLINALIKCGMRSNEVRTDALPSVVVANKNGEIDGSVTMERLRDLTAIPSPYTTGYLDEFFDGVLLPIMQTNRGCPFGCTFCVEGTRFYNKVYRNSGERVGAELEYVGRKMKEVREQGGRNDLFIADSNFAMYPQDLDTCRQIAEVQETYGWPEYINVATGKNKKDRVLEASKIINGALRLSGSVQSLDVSVLENIKRTNIDADELVELALSAGEIGANTYSEIILALPGDTKTAHLRTLRTVMDAGFTNIFLFQLMLLPGTEMASPESRETYGMVTKFRVLPRCYGHFQLFDDDVIAAEIEEICVASDTLSYQEYLDCRHLHLIVTIFHNDGIFGSILKLFRLMNVSVFDWMLALKEQDPPEGLAKVFKSFDTATRNELWDDRGDLENFIQQTGNVERFIAGEFGDNLLFAHKTEAVTEHMADLAEIAFASAAACLEKAGKYDDDIRAFVQDALIYHSRRAENLFFDRNVTPHARLRYDIPGFEQAEKPDGLKEFENDQAQAFKFVFSDEQSALMERYKKIYGETKVGTGRILSKVYVGRLFRHAVPDHD